MNQMRKSVQKYSMSAYGPLLICVRAVKVFCSKEEEFLLVDLLKGDA